MSERPIRVLLIEDNPDQVQLLEEAFSEMEDNRFRKPALPACERTYALDRAEAEETLSLSPFDAVVLDLESTKNEALPAFLRVQETAPKTPVVLLASARHEALALGLLRQGAQDYLLIDEIDCVPLARALRNAVERNRLRVAAQSVSLIDDLSGLYNRRGFLEEAERHCRLAERFGLPVQLWFVEWNGKSPGDYQGLDLQVVEIGEWLRARCPDTAVLGRWSERRLAAANVGESASILQPLVHTGRRWEVASAESGSRVDLALLIEEAEQRLCENRLVENSAGRNL